MVMNKISGTSVGADLSCPPPIYRPSVDVSISGLFCETSLSALAGRVNKLISLSMFIGEKQMSRKKIMGIALLIGAVIVVAGGSFTLLNGHMKTGIGLIVLGVIVIAAGLFTFFSRPSAERYN